MFKKLDLHMHTKISDGTDTPEELITKIIKAGVDLFSVSDHDAIKGGILVPQLLKEMDNDTRPSFIRGVEFSCEDEEGRYHILGYGYDPVTEGIREVVEEGHRLRMKKTEARIAFLEDECGFSFPQEDIDAILAMDNPGKPHIANMMIKCGYVSTITEGITKYIDKKEFISQHVRPEVAIKGIFKSGGIPVLAHPAYGDGDDLIVGPELDERVQRLMGFGLKGVEAFYSGFTPKIQGNLLAIAARYDLYVTAGSDYHGKNKMIDLGWTNLETMDDAPAGMLRFINDVEII